MKSAGLLTFVVSALAAVSAWSAEIDELALLLAGTFDSRLTDASQPAQPRFVDRRIRLDLPTLGQHVFYQQINQNEKLDVYRQRILILEVSDASDQIEQRSYALKDAQRFIDANAVAFTTLGAGDLHEFMADGCEQIWTKTSDGFRGYVSPATCQIVSKRTGKLRSIESESRLTRTTLALVERGFDTETGEQLFGTPPGESLLLGRRRD